MDRRFPATGDLQREAHELNRCRPRGAVGLGAICGAGIRAARQVLAAKACMARVQKRFAKASRKTGFHANPLGWVALNQRS